MAHTPTLAQRARSRVLNPPGRWAAAYFLAIPVFALVYWLMGNSFYAPYAKFEPSSSADSDDVLYVVGQSVIRTLRLRGSDQLKADFKTDHIDVVPTALQSDGDDLKLILIVEFQDAGSEGGPIFDDNYYKAHLPLIVHYKRTERDQKNVENGGRYYQYDLTVDTSRHVPEFHDDLKLGHTLRDDDILQILFPPNRGEKNMQIDIPISDDSVLLNYLDGAAGDPTRLSYSYLRMLYFSAVVITTVGFGDIVPMTGLARLLVAGEAIFGISMAGLFLNSLS